MRALRAAVDPLWPSGLVVLLLFGSSVLLPFRGERLDWSQYLLAAAAIPLLVWLVTTRRLQPALPALRTTLGALFLVLALGLAARFLNRYVLFYAVAQIALTAAATRFARMVDGRWLMVHGDKTQRRPSTINHQPSTIVWGAFVLIPVWVAALHLLWWMPYPSWLAISRYAKLVLLLSLLFVVVVLYWPKTGLATEDTESTEEGDEVGSFEKERLSPRGVSKIAPAPPSSVSSVSSVANPKSEIGRRALRTLGLLTALALIALASLRTDPLFPPTWAPRHHWGPIVGPAELVRQGGWLLWDVPAQYGFLSMLTVALAPFPSIWQSFYFVNASLLFLSASFLFFLLRTVRGGLLGNSLALILTISTVFFMPNLSSDFPGPYHYPAHGAFRFFWCYVLLGCIFWLSRGQGPEGRRQKAEGSPDEWSTGRYADAESRLPSAFCLLPSGLRLGCVAWLLGVFWSFESAVYCSVIWLPVYYVAVLGWPGQARSKGLDREEQPETVGVPRSRGFVADVKEAAQARHSHLLTTLHEHPANQPGCGQRLYSRRYWLALPPALLLAALAAITAYYEVRLGHAPDWRAYGDYVFSFRAGFAALPIDHHGAVWLLIALFCAQATALVAMLDAGGQEAEDGGREAVGPVPGRQKAEGRPDEASEGSSAAVTSGLPTAFCLPGTGPTASRPPSSAFWLLLGAIAAFWALSSYFVGRSLDSHIGSLSVVFCIGIAFVLSLCARSPDDPRLTLAKAAFVPVLAMLIAIPLSDRARARDLAAHLRWNARDPERLVPERDPSLDRLFRAAGVKSDDPLLSVGMDVGPWRGPEGRRQKAEGSPDGKNEYSGADAASRLPSAFRLLPSGLPRAWLPVLPFSLFYPLPDARSRVYFARFVAHRPMSGWLLEPKERPWVLQGPVGPDPIAWFYEELRRTHTPRRSFANERWRLTWYQVVGR